MRKLLLIVSVVVLAFFVVYFFAARFSLGRGGIGEVQGEYRKPLSPAGLYLYKTSAERAFLTNAKGNILVQGNVLAYGSCGSSNAAKFVREDDAVTRFLVWQSQAPLQIKEYSERDFLELRKTDTELSSLQLTPVDQLRGGPPDCE